MLVDNFPALGIDLHGAPIGVRQVDVDFTVVLRRPDMYRVFRALEAGLRLGDRETAGQRFRTGRGALLSVKLMEHPGLEGPRLQWPVFVMAINLNGAVKHAIRIVE